MGRDKQNIKTTDWLIRGIPEEQLEREKREAIKEAEAKLRDRQIEEMVRTVCIQMRDYPKLTCKKCKADNRSTNAYCRIQFEMERLYNAGYRKVESVTFMGGIVEQMRAEVAREIFEEIETILRTLDKQHMLCGNPKQAWGVRSVETKIAELKKKYTEKSEEQYG